MPEPRRAQTVWISDGDTGERIDYGLVLWFRGPKSVTGEDVAEFHVHGGVAVVTAIEQALAAIPGCRAAEPGEFTRRAFENGKVDLVEAEGIADLIDAETEAQRRQAVGQAAGGTGRKVAEWGDRLARSLAHAEVGIDFADEDLPTGLLLDIRSDVATVIAELKEALADGRRGEALRGGLSVVITGPPNSGKSSILNWLAGREAAIVTSWPGTTRDVIEVRLDLEGYPIVLADTAGIRETEDDIEGEGIRRARDRAAAADLCLMVHDAAGGQAMVLDTPGAAAISVWNKIDLAKAGEGGIGVSALTGEGMATLVTAIADFAARHFAGPTPLVTRHRHRLALGECLQALERVSCEGEIGLVAENLRLARRALDQLVGRLGVEDVLDIVFREFCIGK